LQSSGGGAPAQAAPQAAAPVSPSPAPPTSPPSAPPTSVGANNAIQIPIAFGGTVTGDLTDTDNAHQTGYSRQDISSVVVQAGDPNVATLRPTVVFDDNSGGGQDSEFTHTFTQSGLYYLFATSTWPEGRGTYTLTLTRQ